MKKRAIATLMMVTMAITTLAMPAMAGSGDIRVLVDSQAVKFPDAKPVIDSGRTLVPVRFVSEALGAEVQWDGASQVVTVAKGSTVVTLKIDSKTVNKSGQSITLDVPAKIMSSRTYVPLRFVSEAFGCQVDWSEAQRTVYIKTTGANSAGVSVTVHNGKVARTLMEYNVTLPSEGILSVTRSGDQLIVATDHALPYGMLAYVDGAAIRPLAMMDGSGSVQFYESQGGRCLYHFLGAPQSIKSISIDLGDGKLYTVEGPF